MKNGLILLLILSTAVFSSVTLSESKSQPVPGPTGDLTLLKAQIPARNEIRQIKGTGFFGMQDLDGDGWRDDSATLENVLVTTNSFPECNIPFDAYCHTTGGQFSAWVGGAYSPAEHKLRVLAGGGHADGGLMRFIR